LLHSCMAVCIHKDNKFLLRFKLHTL
jgi:hypothetical protein